jgi:hypothetical protein
VKSHILYDVLIPAGKKALSDVLDAFLYGGTGRGGKKNYNASKVSYESRYSQYDDRRRTYDVSPLKTGYGCDDIILDSRGEAEDVLSRMDELINVYGMVSVADLYDLVGITGNYTDNKYGWTNIRGVKVTPVREGYMLKMPKALPLN